MWPVKPPPPHSRFPSARRLSFRSESQRRISGGHHRRIAPHVCDFRALRHEGAFTPPSVRGSLHVHPGTSAGCIGAGCPGIRYRSIIVPVNRLPAIIRLLPRAGFDRGPDANPGAESPSRAGRRLRCRASSFCRRPASRASRRRGANSWPFARTPGRSRGERRSAICSSASTCVASRDWSPNLGGRGRRRRLGLLFIGATIDPFLRPSRRGVVAKCGRRDCQRVPEPHRCTSRHPAVRADHCCCRRAAMRRPPLSKPDMTLVAFALTNQLTILIALIDWRGAGCTTARRASGLHTAFARSGRPRRGVRRPGVRNRECAQDRWMRR